jgi:hypothetical protein
MSTVSQDMVVAKTTQPVIGVAVLPWRDPAQYRSLLAKLSHISAIGVLLRDRDGGRVTIDEEGHPVSHYSLSNFDRAHLRSGFIGAARILEAAGARQIFSPHAKGAVTSPPYRFTDTFTQPWIPPDGIPGGSRYFHFIQGTARLGGSRNSPSPIRRRNLGSARNLYDRQFMLPLHQVNWDSSRPLLTEIRLAERMN